MLFNNGSVHFQLIVRFHQYIFEGTKDKSDLSEVLLSTLAVFEGTGLVIPDDNDDVRLVPGWATFPNTINCVGLRKHQQMFLIVDLSSCLLLCADELVAPESEPLLLAHARRFQLGDVSGLLCCS